MPVTAALDRSMVTFRRMRAAAHRHFEQFVQRRTFVDESPLTFEPDARHQAGFDSEANAYTELSIRLKGLPWILHANVFIPSATDATAREIDMVITRGTETFVVELKTWSGELAFENDVLYTTPRHVNEMTRRISHGKVFQRLHENTDMLRCLCARITGQPAGVVKPFVVFFKPRSLVVPQEISDRPDILTFGQLIRLLIDVGNTPLPGNYDPAASPIARALRELAHKDLVAMHNGTTIEGRFLGGPRISDGKASRRPDRASTRQITIDIPRHRLLRWLMPSPSRVRLLAQAWDGRITRYTACPEKTIFFRLSDTPYAPRIGLRQIDHIVFGNAVTGNPIASGITPGALLIGVVDAIPNSDDGAPPAISVWLETKGDAFKRYQVVPEQLDVHVPALRASVGRLALVRVEQVHHQDRHLTVDSILLPHECHENGVLHSGEIIRNRFADNTPGQQGKNVHIKKRSVMSNENSSGIPADKLRSGHTESCVGTLDQERLRQPLPDLESADSQAVLANQNIKVIFKP